MDIFKFVDLRVITSPETSSFFISQHLIKIYYSAGGDGGRED